MVWACEAAWPAAVSAVHLWCTKIPCCNEPFLGATGMGGGMSSGMGGGGMQGGKYVPVRSGSLHTEVLQGVLNCFRVCQMQRIPAGVGRGSQGYGGMGRGGGMYGGMYGGGGMGRGMSNPYANQFGG